MIKEGALSYVDDVVEAARQLAAQGDLDAAGRTLEQAAEKHPESYAIWTHLGLFYYQSGRYNRALHAFQHRLDLFPADIHVCLILADIFEKRREYNNAGKWLQEAMRCEGNRENLQQRVMELERKERTTSWRKFLKMQWLKKSLMRLNEWMVGFIERLGKFSTLSTGGDARTSMHGAKRVFRLSNYLKFMRRYDPAYYSEGMAYHKTREVLLASSLLPIDDSQALILDLGTGKNSLPLFWSMFGCRTVAMDGSLYGFSNLVQIEKRLNPKPTSLVGGDMRFLPFADNAFDGISSLCAIEHIPGEGDIETLREIYRVLKPGGRAVITVETCQTHQDTWLEVPYEIGYQADGGGEQSGWEEVFCRNYSPETLRSRLLESAPWRLVEEGFYDDNRFPLRRWLEPNNYSPLALILRRFQPLLSLLFYRKTSTGSLTPSSIGYLVVEKP